MSDRELDEALAQYHPEAVSKAPPIRQREVIRLIRKLHSELLYISFDRFKGDIRCLTMRLIEHIKGEGYAV